MTPPRLLLLSGIPGTGKSHFGRWLSREKGYVHVDVEEAGRLEQAGLASIWSACFHTREVGPLVERLRGLGPRVALDWGFPPEWIDVVRELTRHGVVAWWFDGDRDRAREAFLERGTVSVAALDVQLKKIESRWLDMEALYGPNRLHAIDAEGRRLPPPDIWARIAS